MYTHLLTIYLFLKLFFLQNDQFVVEDLHRAMLVDGLTSSRPVVPPEVNTPSEINALFDAISYSKGACIIRMINEFSEDEAFRLGLKVLQRCGFKRLGQLA